LREAIAYLEGLLQTATPNDPESVNKFFAPRHALAYAHLLQGNPGATRKYISEALDVLGQVKTVKGGYSFPIITPFSFSLVTVPPTRFNINGVYAAFYNLQGLAQFAIADYDGAAESFRQRLYKLPDYVPYLYLGRVALEKDDLQEAVRDFRTSLDKQATDIARLYYSVVLKLSGDETAAQAQYEQAVNAAQRRNLTAKSHYAYFEALGRAHQAWGRLDEAAAAYARVVDAVPQLGYGHRQLGEVYWRQGNKVAAVSQFQEAQRLMPDDPRTIALLQ
jgi:tetratricopeptide (TPR) repeat protein